MDGRERKLTPGVMDNAEVTDKLPNHSGKLAAAGEASYPRARRPFVSAIFRHDGEMSDAHFSLSFEEVGAWTN